MRYSFFLCAVLSLITARFSFAENPANQDRERYVFEKFGELPALDDGKLNPGVAGAFSGIIDQYLVIAGGANFPDKRPWEGGIKRFHDEIYICSTDGAKNEWKVYKDAFTRELAYGISVTLPDGILCIGGTDAERTYANVFLMKFDGIGFTFEEWPSLPVPLSNMAGAYIDGRIYIAGGVEDAVYPSSTSSFFMLDTGNRSKGWVALPTWPGPPRAYAVAAGQSDGFDRCLYLFSGRNISPGKPWEVLNDGYVYNPRLSTWKKLDDSGGPVFPVMAGSAVPVGANHIMLVGGTDGILALQQRELERISADLETRNNTGIFTDSINDLKSRVLLMQENHPGFSREILLYHTITNTVINKGEAPYNIPVTTNIIKAGNSFIITSGEVRPGVRTPDLISIVQERTVQSFGLVNNIVLIIYFGVLVLMGWFFSRRQKTSNDYFRGGGRVPWWAAGLSIFGTALSSITFMAIPAKAYATDWSYIFMNAGIIFVAPLIVYLFIPFYRRLNLTTAYDYLEQRFNISTRLICSVSYILYQVGRMGIVILLPSIAINVVTGIDIFLCIGLMGVLSLVYTIMGGIEAVIWTDALQVLVLLGGALIAIVYMIANVDGGFGAIVVQGAADGKFNTASLAWDLKNPTLWTVLIATLFSKTTEYGADQTMVQRYLTTRDVRTASRGVWMNAALTVPATLIFFIIGTCLYVFYKASPQLLSSTITDGDAIFPWFIINSLPAGISGLLIGGIFAAAMSTLSASMNSSATAYCVDIHFRFGLTKHDQLKVAKTVTLVLGLIGILFAVLMATWDIKSLWDEMQKIIGLVIGGMGGLFMLGLLTRRANGIGAVIGLLSSIVVQVLVSKTQAVHLLLYATTGFLSCFIVGYLASLLFSKKTKNITHLTVYKFSNKKTND
ncbi:MAG: sodium/solute symporter [Bacteroidales bacterium]|nr:sodium/solute symporter [Bacteroidales bacterium]